MADAVVTDPNGVPIHLEDWANSEFADQLGNVGQTVVAHNDDGVPITLVVTTDNRFAVVPYGVSPDEYARSSPENRITLQQLGSETETRDTNRDAVMGTAGGIIAGQQATSDVALASDLTRLQQEAALRDAAYGADAALYGDLSYDAEQTRDAQLGTLGLMGGLYGDAASAENFNTAWLNQAVTDANTRSALMMGEFEDAATEAESRDLGALDTLDTQYLRSLYGGQDAVTQASDLNQRLQEGDIPWGVGVEQQATTGADGRVSYSYERPGFERWQDISSEAALAGADPYDIESQRDALYRTGLAADAAQSYESRAAQAAADAAAVENQGDALALWRRYAGLGVPGAIEGEPGAPPIDDITSREAVAYADPEAVAAQKRALADMYGLTSGELTEVERFNMERARRSEERDRRAAMSALQSDLRERGVGGSGAEVAGLLGTQQGLSETRMLQDMAAAAQARERADRMLQSYAQLGGQIREQSFGEEARRGEAWDEMALANRANRMRALGAMTDLSGQMRGQSFDEEFRTGEAADRVAMQGQDNALRALGLYGDLSSRMREQGFEEQYRTGQSADAFAQFNAENSESQQRWMQEYNRQLDEDMWRRQAALSQMQQSEADRSWQQAMGYSGAQRDVAGDEFARQQALWSTGLDENQQAYARQGDTYSAMTGATGRTYDRGTQLGETALKAQEADYARQADLAGFGTGLTGVNYSRGTDYLDSLRQSTADYYNREQDRQNDLMNLTQLYTSGEQSAQAGISQAYQTQLGQRNADAAMAALNEQQGLLDDDIPLVGLF